MLELSIVKLLLNKEYYNKYSKLLYNIKTEKSIEKLMRCIAEYFAEYPHHEYIAKDELLVYYKHLYPADANNEEILSLFERLKTLEVSDSLAATIINSFLERSVATDIVETLMPALSGEETNLVFQIPQIIDDYREAVMALDQERSPFIEDSLADLATLTDNSAGLSWGLQAMDNNIGRLSGRTLGHVFARVETGKSSFISNSIVSFASQLGDDERVLWVGNEEDGRRFRYRTFQTALGMSPDEIGARIHEHGTEQLEEQYHQKGCGKILFKYDPGVTVEDITALLERYGAKVVIVDIADHVPFRGSKDMNGPQKLEELYRRYRQMAVNYGCDIITVGQAGADAAGRKELHIEHMYNSKTGKPGALDYALGIGATYKQEEASTRWINFVKNKNGTTKDPIIPVQFDAMRGRFYG